MNGCISSSKIIQAGSLQECSGQLKANAPDSLNEPLKRIAAELEKTVMQEKKKPVYSVQQERGKKKKKTLSKCKNAKTSSLLTTLSAHFHQFSS